MNLQEREIELTYLNKIIERVTNRGDAMYARSPECSHEYNNYARNASLLGTYSYEEEQRLEQDLEQEMIKWRKSDEAKEYSKTIMDLGKMLGLRATLEGLQENYIIDKYKL